MTTTSVCQRCGEPIFAEDRFCGACGTPLTATATPAQAPPPLDVSEHSTRLLAAIREATVGQYEIRGELGRGGMAAVYLAYDLRLNRKVAVKVMFPDLAFHEGMEERFKREAQTAAKLDHTNIVGIYSVRDDASLLYFVMKYIDGAPLDHVLRTFAPLPLPVAQRILDELCDALQFAHEEGVVHRDVKPANVLVDRRGRSLVTDFGIARASESPQITRTGAVIGTPAYMSPEQCLGSEQSPASDQYALGVVAYEMLAGRTPFTGPVVEIQWAHVKEQPPSLLTFRPDCPPTVAAAVMRMLAKSPNDRWPTLDDARRALTAGLTPGDDSARTRLVEMVRAVSPATAQPFAHTPASPMPRARQSPLPIAPAPISPRPISPPPVAPAPISPRPISPPPIAPAPIPQPPVREPELVIGQQSVSGELAAQPAAITPPPATPQPAARERRRIPLLVPIGAGAAALLAVVLFFARDGDGDPRPDTTRVLADTPVAKVDTIARPPTPEPQPQPPPPDPRQPGPNPPAVTPQITALRAVSASPLRIEIGERRTAAVTAAMSDGSTQSSPRVRWRAANAAIIAVTPTGEISGVSAGTTQAVASIGAVSVGLDVIVSAAAPARVTLTGGDSVRVGQSAGLTARVVDARNSQIDAPISWRSTNAAIASVNSRGAVQGIRAGDAYIVATSGAHTDSARIVVFAPVETPRDPTPTPTPPPNNTVTKPAPRVADVDAFANALVRGVSAALQRGSVGSVTPTPDFQRFVKDNSPITMNGDAQITRGPLTDNRVEVTIVLPVRWRDFSGRTKTGTIDLLATYEVRNGAWEAAGVRPTKTPR